MMPWVYLLYQFRNECQWFASGTESKYYPVGQGKKFRVPHWKSVIDCPRFSDRILDSREHWKGQEAIRREKSAAIRRGAAAT